MKPPEKPDLFGHAAPSATQMPNVTTEVPGAGPLPNASSIEELLLKASSIAVANQAWRITGAILDPETKDAKCELSPQEIKKICNALENIVETLARVGIRMIDRTGEPFNAGLPEEVVTEETQEGISREQIVRTIRPTIMWHQIMVQRGEIEIAVPPFTTKQP